MNLTKLLLILTLLLPVSAWAGDKPTIRLGVMASGTLNWELSALRNEHLLDHAEFNIETVTVANQQAGKVALQAGAVDMIVSDWIWVSSMRSEGADFSFYPYSTTAGALMISTNSGIVDLEGLRGKKLGIAGGELDKNWLLLQALAKRQGVELDKDVEKVYGAPPLLNQQLQDGRLDAVLTYWQFAAKLESVGYKRLLNGEEMIRQLGIGTAVPSLGYVFHQSWADQHKPMVKAFLQATQSAKQHLCTVDAAWQKIIPLTEADDSNVQAKLRQGYCDGRVGEWSAEHRQAAEKVYGLLHQINSKLTGNSAQLHSGSFWSAD